MVYISRNSDTNHIWDSHNSEIFYGQFFYDTTPKGIISTVKTGLYNILKYQKLF